MTSAVLRKSDIKGRPDFTFGKNNKRIIPHDQDSLAEIKLGGTRKELNDKRYKTKQKALNQIESQSGITAKLMETTQHSVKTDIYEQSL